MKVRAHDYLQSMSFNGDHCPVLTRRLAWQQQFLPSSPSLHLSLCLVPLLCLLHAVHLGFSNTVHHVFLGQPLLRFPLSVHHVVVLEMVWGFICASLTVTPEWPKWRLLQLASYNFVLFFPAINSDIHQHYHYYSHHQQQKTKKSQELLTLDAPPMAIIPGFSGTVEMMTGDLIQIGTR